jgi:hypothetical protein
MPVFRSCKDQFYRGKGETRPKLPGSLREVDIAKYDDLSKTETGKTFWNGKTKTLSEVFMSPTQIEIAFAGESLFIDGTFSMCPFPFYQVLFLRTRVGSNRYIICTCLLPNKQEQTYHDVFAKIN